MPCVFRFACLLFTLFLASGCASTRSETAEGAPLARQITQSSHCGLTAPGSVHLTSPDEVERLAALPARNLSLAPLKRIEFEREHIILVALGQKSTGGYGVTLSSSKIRNGTLDLTVAVTEPAPGTLVTQALTTPCAVIAVTAEGWSDIQISRSENNR